MVTLPGSALPDPGVNSTGGSSDGGDGDDKVVVEETPVLLDTPSAPVTAGPDKVDQKTALKKDPLSLITGETPLEETTPEETTPEAITSPPAEELAATEPTPELTATPPPETTPSLEPTLEPTVTSPPETTLSRGPTPGPATSTDTPDDDEIGWSMMRSMSAPVVTATTSSTATPSPEPTRTVTTPAGDSDDSDDAETEETPTPGPTQRDAPPRPNATMAKAHQSHGRPLPQSDHQIVTSASAFTPDGSNETGAGTSPPLAAPHDGLIIKGVGVLLDRTPEDIALTRSGVEIANLDWLLDPAMTLGGRHPRAVFEGETFAVTVTVEARNLTAIPEGPAYVVLVPPPGETGVYEITRTREPGVLQDGERGVWEFSVTTRTGRLTLADLTLPEERLITDLTSNPELFAFRAYAFAGDQEPPSSGLSDPVLAIRPDGNEGSVEDRPLPVIYAIAGISNSPLTPSETIPGAWQREVGHDMIVAGAVGGLDALKSLGKEEIAAVYDEEMVGGTEEPAGSSSSPFDMIVEFFRGLFGWAR
ncbi:hypothetical protein [Methanoculleus sp.]|uniref:hypothetical protein n=1 Tax=Methanoculleus sp. TaxID=90427 RepID=UPI0025FD771A|nr:hypothetical protein [Methanoculleus sp.]